MENLKLQRKMLRELFTENANQIEEYLEQEIVNKKNIVSLLRQLEDISERLFRADENINELLFSSEVTIDSIRREFEEVQQYRKKLIECKTTCEFRTTNDDCRPEELSKDAQSSTSRRSKRNFNLPKLELKKFNGDIKQWLGFWGQFRKIHEDPEIDVEDKFLYLIQATEEKSPPRALVESFPPHEASYVKVIEQLKARFARDDMLIEVYVRELLNVVLTQATSNKSGTNLATLYDKLVTQLNALESLGVTCDKYAAMLLPLVESALPGDLLIIWERQRKFNKLQNVTSLQGDMDSYSYNNNNLSMLLDFLKGEVEAEQRINRAQIQFQYEDHSSMGNKVKETQQRKLKLQQSNPEIYTAAALYSADSRDMNFGKKIPICIFCGNSHSSQDCLKAQKLSLEERKSKISSKRGCFSCLKLNHNSRMCKSFIKCLICSRKHYPIMCPDLVQRKDTTSTDNSKSQDNNSVQNVLTSNISSQVLLQTIIVQVVNNNKTKIVRALCDSGSQRSYIVKHCANELNLQKSREETIIQGVFGGQQSSPTVHAVYDFTIQSLNNNFKGTISALEQTKICNYIPRINDINCIEYLKQKNIIINDTAVNNPPDEIELLLGADVFGTLLTGKTEILSNGLVAIETRLGWTITGKYFENNSNLHIFSGFSDFNLVDLWTLDVLGIKDPTEVKTREAHEEQTIKHFNETVICNDEGRYEIHLPWIEGHPKLLNNTNLAQKRLVATTQNLLKKEMIKDYDELLLLWEDLGIIETVTDEEVNSKYVHYLPHHAVIKESSTTTRVRPVFDASAKDSDGNSLNACLEKGPNLLELIPPLILKFRISRIGVTADIEKAFLQISITPKDRDFLRFFWWKDYNQDIKKEARHCRVVFGVKSSPFLLAATIAYHLNKAPDNLRVTAEKLKESFYVDNCVTSVENEDELEKFIHDSKLLMSLGKFNLREWVHTPIFSSEEISNPTISPILGMLWDVNLDVLFCDLNSLNNPQSIQRTKRGLLSTAQRIFDPIGYTCPVSLIPKLLLQETWALQLQWDQELPVQIKTPFDKWINQIHLLSLCKIPRTICTFLNLSEADNMSLHVFCDASKLAVGTCIFLRAKRQEEVSIRLVQAKSRVAPKKLTLPRLELLSTVIGIRLCQSIKRVPLFEQIKTYYWSDSMVALTWIKTKANWNTFVGNRVKEIRLCSQIEEWNHVPGAINPADVTSRGCNVKTLLENKWWEGPTWLREDIERWPRNEIVYSEKDVNAEMKKSVAVIMVSEIQIINKFLYFSKYNQILRMIAWMFRFCNNTRKNNSKILGVLKFEEVNKAKIMLLKMVQTESFSTEIIIIKNLETFKDENGIIRIKTRLVHSDDNDDFKFPILLPFKNEIVNRLIEYQHNIHSHAGVQILLSILRERFWILRARKTVKMVISRCIICRRYSAKSADTQFAPLPKDRITCVAVFQVTGIDLAGPLYLKEGGKAWIVLFTCAVYRAVHLELVKSLSTDSFMMALRRFTARRSRVSTIYTDNGSNFVGASNLLNQIDWTKIIEYSNIKRIKWIFNPPTACWWGGWWEIMVRLVKDILRRNLGRCSFNYEEIMTILCDTEAVVNARTLTYLSEEDNFIPLSPSTFLNDTSSSCEVPDLDAVDRTYLVKRVRHIQKVRDNIRQRFKKEYLAQLINIGQRKQNSLKVGDIVYIGNDNRKRGDWLLGKIIEIYPGKDNVPRVAKVRTMNGNLIRPFQRLFPLEICEADSQELKTNYLEKDSGLEGKLAENLQDEEERREKEEVKIRQDKKCEKGKPNETYTRSGRLSKFPVRYGVD